MPIETGKNGNARLRSSANNPSADSFLFNCSKAK